MRARSFGSRLFVLALSLVLHAHVARAQEGDASPDGAVARAIASTRDAVAVVRCGDARVGTAFALGSADRLVTSWHVADCPRRLSVEGRDGRRVTARVAASDVDHDVALLVGDGLTLAVPTPREEPLEIGEPVVAVGFTGGERGLVVHAGAVANVTADVIRTDAGHPGTAGGPALDASGRVVGIVATAYGDGIAHVIPVQWALSLADEPVSEGEARSPVRFHFGVGIGALVIDERALFAADAHVSADLWDELTLRVALQVAGGTSTEWAPEPTQRSESLVAGSAMLGYRFRIQLDDAIALTITPEIGAWVGLRTVSGTEARLGFADPGCDPSSQACALATRADTTTTESILARPTLGVRMGLGDVLELGYQLQLDVEHPEASGHLVTFGFTL